MHRAIVAIVALMLCAGVFAALPVSAAFDPFEVRVISNDPKGSSLFYSSFEPHEFKVGFNQAIRFVLAGEMYPTTVTIVETNQQTKQLTPQSPTADVYLIPGNYSFVVTSDPGSPPARGTVTEKPYGMGVPLAYGPYASPTPVPVTPTATPPPGPKPNPPTGFNVTLEFGQAKVTWTTPDGQNLFYSYATCNQSVSPCNRLDLNTFVSQPVATTPNTTRTSTFSNVPLGYTCFWVRHRSGSTGTWSDWYPTNVVGTSDNCVFR